MKRRFFAILSAFLLLMAVFGIGIVAAEDSTDSGSTDSGSTDSGSTDSGSTDSGSTDSGSTDDGSASDSSSSDNSASDSSSDTDSGSTDSGSASDSGSNEESSTESGDVSAEDNSNSADDGSTIVDVEETNAEETTVGVQDADDVIVSDGPVEHNEANTEVTNIDDTDTTIIGNGNEEIVLHGTAIISDVDNSYESNYSTNYTSTDIAILQNSTQNIDNSNEYTYNSTTIINKPVTKTVNIDNSQNTNINFEDNSVVNNITFVSKESGETKVIVKEVSEKPPVENVYKTFNIWVENADITSNMENAGVDFKVEKTWLIENNLDSSTIILNMYENGKWIEVPVTITGEDSKYVYFSAKVSKYSTFAISSKAVTVDKVLKQECANNTTANGTEEDIDEQQRV